MRKKRAVKEGSPFEEEYLLEVIKEETICTDEDKNSVKQLMQILVLFGLIPESIQLHSLVAKVLQA